MMRSMYSAVSGLKNHQTRMDVIGNNIANVNTTGFKKSRVVFKDSLYQSLRGASRATDARGGTNPMAIGLGMTISSVDQIHTPAPTTYTNNATDVAIDGGGYFILDNGGQIFYSRAGNFNFDELGNFVNMSNGFRVMGWMADEGKINTTRDYEAIDISNLKTVAPKATEKVIFGGNLDSNLPVVADPATESDPNNMVVTCKEIYDSLGNKHLLYFRMSKIGTDTVTAHYTDSSGTDQTTSIDVTRWRCEVSFSPDFPQPSSGTGDLSETQILENVLIFDGSGQFPTRVKVGDETYAITSIDGYTIPPKVDLTADMTNGAANINFEVDFSEITQWEAQSNAEPVYQDGYAMGSLTGYSIGIDGIIQGNYDNGITVDLARLAIANFQNPGGLIQAGGSLFQVSNNSGDPLVGAPGEAGMSSLTPSSLEMSNVDLSEEFTDMIVTQRGFQANSRIITTSDEMLQELVNLKR
jgi:flagellar hook protein FlgE